MKVLCIKLYCISMNKEMYVTLCFTHLKLDCVTNIMQCTMCVTVELAVFSHAASQAYTKRGAARLQPHPNQNLKKLRFCSQDDIKRFTLFPLKPKSATEIG